MSVLVASDGSNEVVCVGEDKDLVIMCEQPEVQYLDGEIVWVKLGPSWWPGEVCDSSKLPPEIIQSLKKRPIAIVKFFQEHKYEYIRDLNQIYKYNCRKKNEFIKKGMDMHRAKIKFMDKFPADVRLAETLTGGDPGIVTSDKFAPEQKPSYAAIFRTPRDKKTPKIGGRRGRPTLSTRKPLKSPATTRIIHPRFVGKNDHEVRILEQNPNPKASHYTCHICGFETTRLNVIVLHNKGHSNGTYVTPSKEKSRSSSTSSKKGKKAKSFASTRSINKDVELIRQGLILSADDSSDSDTEQESGKKTSGKRKTAKSGNSPNKKAKVSNICKNLLADWDNSDSNKETPAIFEKPPTVIEKLTVNNATESAVLVQDKTVANNNVHSELLADWKDKNSDGQSTRVDSPVHKIETSSLDKYKEMEETYSCFDFKADDDIKILEMLPGRKMPRVIPLKRVPFVADINIKYESKRNVPDSTYEQFMGTRDDSNKIISQEPDLEPFESVLSATAVPEITDLPETKVSADDMMKRKDKRQDVEKTNGALKNSGQSSSEADSKATESNAQQLPKKRFVRSLEAFEIFFNEQKQAEEESALSKTTPEVYKLKSQIMTKLNDPPQKQINEEPARVESKNDSETKSEEKHAQKLIKQTNSNDSQNELECVDDKSETISFDKITNDVHEKIFETPDEVIYEETFPESVKRDTESSRSFEPGEVDTVEISEEIENSTCFKEPVEFFTKIYVEADVDAAVNPTNDPSNEQTFEAENSIEQANETIIETTVGSNFEKGVPPVEEVATSKFDTHTESIKSIIEPTETYADTIPKVNSETVSEIPETFVNKSAIKAPKNSINETEQVVAESESQSLEIYLFPNEEFKENKYDTTETTKDFQECHKIEHNIDHAKEIFMETEEHKKIIEEKDDTTESINLVVPHVINNESNIEVGLAKKNSEVIAEQPVMQEMHTTQNNVEDTRFQKILVDISDICIDNTDNLLGLTTFAAVSDLTGNPYEKPETINLELSLPEAKQTDFIPKPSDSFEETTLTTTTQHDGSQMSEKIQVAEDIPVSESQVLNSEAMDSVADKLTATLANYSMDFSDLNSESTINKSMSAEETNTTANVEKISEQVDDAASIPNQEDILKPVISKTTNKNTLLESKIEKILSMETNSDKLNSFTENISHHSSECRIVFATDIAYQNYTVPGTSKISTDNNKFESNMEETIAVTSETLLESEIAKLTLGSQTTITSKDQLFTTSSGQALVTSDSQVLTPITQQQLKSIKSETLKLGKKIQIRQSRLLMSEKESESHKNKLNIMKSNTKTISVKGFQSQTLKKLQAPVGDLNTMVMAQSSHKGQLMSLGRQQIQLELSNKELVLPSKSSGGKSDVKLVAGKQMSDKLQKVQSPKQILTTSGRVVQKSSECTQMLLSPVSCSSASKQSTLTSIAAVLSHAPITAAPTKKLDQTLAQKQTEPKISTSLLDSKDETSDASAPMLENMGDTQQKTPNQLIIKDAMGNQTTVTQGQILALSSGETVYGQPQSNEFVTVDRSGNLVPISNDTLMSLYSNLCLGGEMNPILLQIEQAAQDKQAAEAKAKPLLVENQTYPLATQPIFDTNKQQQLFTMENQQLILADQNLLTKPTTTEQQVSTTGSQLMYVDKDQESFATNAKGPQSATTSTEQLTHLQDTQAVACSINSGKSSQQLIVIFDPESTQTFLPWLSEGNTDLSRLLSGTDGNIFLKMAGQQIQVSVDAENQILQFVNSDSIGLIQPSKKNVAQQSSLYETKQAMKNQDIQAAALAEPDAVQQDTQAVPCSVNSGKSSQQLIVTFDPESTKAVLLLLSDRNTDLSRLPSTDGNIVVKIDGQQILGSVDAENLILQFVNSDSNGLIQPSTESVAAQSSLYETKQAMKSQDIQAAAFAEPDVGDKPVAPAAAPALTKVTSSAQWQLSPDSTLYPMNVSNVFETSLTLDSPIMKLLEVPGVNKKITSTGIESALITQVPILLDLPIIITDPSISQMVSQQVTLENNMQTNLELPITINNPGIASISSSEMSSPSFVYTLSTLDEGSELDGKRKFLEITAAATATITGDSLYNTTLTGSMSMPQLTEEPEMPIIAEQTRTNYDDTAEVTPPEATISETIVSESDHCRSYSVINTENIQTSITEKITNGLQMKLTKEELDLIEGEYCSSLSEPPPNLFDKSCISFPF